MPASDQERKVSAGWLRFDRQGHFLAHLGVASKSTREFLFGRQTRRAKRTRRASTFKGGACWFPSYDGVS